MRKAAKEDQPNPAGSTAPKPEACGCVDQGRPPCPDYPQFPMAPAPEHEFIDLPKM